MSLYRESAKQPCCTAKHPDHGQCVLMAGHRGTHRHPPPPPPPVGPCPKCGGALMLGYGLAAGGCGMYEACDRCDHIASLGQDLPPTGHKRRLLARMLDYDEPAMIPASDLVVLCEEIGDEPLEAMAAARGYRLVPAASSAHGGLDLLEVASDVMREASEVLTETARSIASGISPGEAQEIERQIQDAHRSLGALSAAVACAVVTPIRGGR